MTGTAVAHPPSVPALSHPAARAAAAVGGALALAGDAYHLLALDDRPSQAATFGYRLHGFALVLGLVLLVLASAALARHPTPLLRVALPLLTLGTTLVVGDIWAETVVAPGVVGSSTALLGEDIGGFHLASVVVAYLLFALGWLLYAVAALRGGWVTRPVGVLLALGAVLAFLPIGGSYVLLSLGMALMGWAATAPGR